MNIPRVTMERRLKEQEKELSNDISNLNKKSKYLEKQHIEANAQLRDIVSHFYTHLFDSVVTICTIQFHSSQST